VVTGHCCGWVVGFYYFHAAECWSSNRQVFTVITSMTAAELNRVVGGGIRDVLSQYLNGCYY
jgi:hypothetical protein